jgi:CheY-like chemotaxis protein
MSAALTDLGHEVRGFLGGRAALEAASAWRPDLIIADILMPEMDGLTFAKLVRRYEDVPVMFVSIARKEAEAVLLGAAGYVQKPATAAEIRSAVTAVLGHPQTKNAILVVDDDPDVRDIYRASLEPTFEVIEAEHGRAALELLHERRRVDLAIVDVHMPVMNGVELIRAIRADAAIDRLPVIVQTSDVIALRAPVWRDLHVAQLLDKADFFSWLDSHIVHHVSGRASTGEQRQPEAALERPDHGDPCDDQGAGAHAQPRVGPVRGGHVHDR